jgi:transporter family-2 protein
LSWFVSPFADLDIFHVPKTFFQCPCSEIRGFNDKKKTSTCSELLFIVLMNLSTQNCKHCSDVQTDFYVSETTHSTTEDRIMDKIGLIILAIFAGMSNGFQAPVNAALGKFVGVVESSCISFSVGALAMLVVSMVAGQGSILKIVAAPPYLWIGGVLGAFFVTTALFVVPKIGAAVMIASVLTGQMAAALIIDQTGMLGITKNPIDLYRIGGLACLVVGIKLLSK